MESGKQEPIICTIALIDDKAKISAGIILSFPIKNPSSSLPQKIIGKQNYKSNRYQMTLYPQSRCPFSHSVIID